MPPLDFALISVALLSILLLRISTNPLNFFNPLTYFYWTYFIFCFIAVLYRDLYTYAITISNNTILIITLGLIAIPLGGYAANTKKSSKKSHTPLQVTIGKACSSITTRGYLIAILISLPIIISTIFTIKAGKILWLSDSFDDERITIRQGSGWISILGISSAYIATIYSSIHFHKSNSTLKATITTLALAITAISYGNRAPGLEIIIIGGIFIWIQKFGKLKAIHFITGVAVSLLLIMTLGVLRQGLELNVESIYKQVLWRPFTNIQNIEWIVNFIPKHHDYFYGRSILIDLEVLLPGYQPNFGTYMKDAMGKDFSGGSITVSFLGQAYADFGPYFSIILIFLAGFIFQKLFLYLATKGKWTPLMITISITAKSMASSGIVSPIIYTLIPSLIFISFWLILKTLNNKK